MAEGRENMSLLSRSDRERQRAASIIEWTEDRGCDISCFLDNRDALNITNCACQSIFMAIKQDGSAFWADGF